MCVSNSTASVYVNFLNSSIILLLMVRRPPRSTHTDTLFPYTTLVRSRLELLVIDPSIVVGNLLRAAHAQALARLDGLDVVRCLQQRLVRARVEPRVAAAKLFEVQPALLEIAAVEVGDFQFAARRRLERGREVAGTPVRSEEHTSELQSLNRISSDV